MQISDFEVSERGWTKHDYTVRQIGGVGPTMFVWALLRDGDGNGWDKVKCCWTNPRFGHPDFPHESRELSHDFHPDEIVPYVEQHKVRTEQASKWLQMFIGSPERAADR